MKIISASALIILFSAFICFAAGDNFDKLDTNKDGKVSKKEYLDSSARTFDRLDKNKDGFLTKDELKAIDKLDRKRFLKEEDADNDGKISREEFTNAAEKRFKFLDKDNDGYIDQKEWSDIKDGINPKKSKTTPVSPLMIFTF